MKLIRYWLPRKTTNTMFFAGQYPTKAWTARNPTLPVSTSSRRLLQGGGGRTHANVLEGFMTLVENLERGHRLAGAAHSIHSFSADRLPPS